MLERLLAEESSLRLALYAVLVGIIAGLGAVFFRGMIALVHQLSFFGTFSYIYDANQHTAASPLGWLIILVPIGGAIVVAFLVSKFAPEAKGHGVPEVMDAMYYNRGIIRPIVALVKALASAISIGTGGAVGREGPIIQIGAAFGSAFSQLIKLRQWQRMTLIACGAAGGIAATFNTPIGGVLFAVELIMPEISVRTLIPVALATGTATTVGRVAFGDYPALDIPTLGVTSLSVVEPMSLLTYLVFGLLLGGVCTIFIRSIYGAEDLFERMPGNYYSRHMLGMLIVGIEMYMFMHFAGHYYVQGVGYATVQDVLMGTLANPWFLLLLCTAKLLATSLTLGSGASGGVFSPSLFMGATLGGAYGILVSHIPGVNVDPISMAVIGMAGVVGGATGAVVTAIVMVFEMTRDYNVIIPLLITVSLAYGVRRFFLRASIYHLKLERRGHFIPESLQTNMYLLYRVKDILRRPVVRVHHDSDLQKLNRYLARRRRMPHLMITNADQVLGIVTAERLARLDWNQAVEEILREHATSQYVVVGADDMLFDAVARLRSSHCNIALVTTSGELKDPRELQGLLTWTDIARISNLPRSLLVAREAVAANKKPA